MLITQSTASTGLETQTHQSYAYWRMRLMCALIVGYAAMYLVRSNFAIAMPQMLKELGYEKWQIGSVITTGSLVYGVSKFISGVMADRSNTRYFMSIGLLGAALANIAIGLSDTLWTIGVFCVINQCFQSMGWPSCTRTLTRWYGPSDLGTKWAICNISHQVGASIIMVAGAWLVTHYSWRHAFIVPGIVCVFLAFFIFERLRDTPESLGLPSIEEYEGLARRVQSNQEEENLSFFNIFLKYLLPNRHLWNVCFANFFVYVVRYGIIYWAPTYFREAKGVSLLQAGWYTTAFEFAGLLGGVAAGWLSDRVFAGYRGRVGFLFMMCVSVGILLFWLAPGTTPWLSTLLMIAMGFFIYGPQVLVGVAAAEFGSKKAACAAAGFTGVFGAGLGAAVAGVGIGALVDNFGWDAMLFMLVVFGFIGAGLFMMNWNVSCQVKR